ncbi:NAD(P)-dependent oxidoreductase [Longitalea arenae]|uniref:NAD(P)-dependent oxidoreductase n=1 Tax=Longitalea arenae TaxID=2812558 RepID=UPI0019687316|nr:NAD(P)-dependent oxidoreductase [Longitalea arenae]
MKAFLGMGLLGSNFVQAMLRRGEFVHVWNRTASKAQALEKAGARAFTQVQDAVRGATEIHLTLKDDTAVDEVLMAAEPALHPGAIIIDHTTTSKEGAIKRTRVWKEKGFTFQHAPVFMGPANALDGTGFMLLSGDEKIISDLTPSLEKMTGKLLYFGAEVGKAAAMKLAGNAFLVCLTAGLKDTLTLSKALGVSLEDLLTLFGSWNPGALVTARLQRMTGADHSQPSWELNMARKDTQLFIDATQQSGDQLLLMPAIAALMDEWINKGFGGHDWTIIGK